MTKPKAILSPHQLRRLAVAACVTEPTAKRYYEGLPGRSTTRARIDEAVRELGFPERKVD
jgi:hypothetical protein